MVMVKIHKPTKKSNPAQMGNLKAELKRMTSADVFNYIELFYNSTRRLGIITCRQWDMKRTIFETRKCLEN